MKLLEITTDKGQRLFINPKRIICLDPWNDEYKTTIIFDEGTRLARYTVKEDVEDLARRIEKCLE